MRSKAYSFTGALMFAILAGCSAATEPAAPGAEILCAAEALKASRKTRIPADQNLLLNRASIFEEKLPPTQHDQAHRTAERLADQPGDTPSIDAEQCDALLTAEDLAKLRTGAAAPNAEQAPN